MRSVERGATLPDLEFHGAAKLGEEARLRALAHELGVAPRVRFHGPFDDAELPRILAACAAVAIPSRLEGFGIGVLEAQRARAPLAIAEAGALPEVAGPDAPRFDPDDPAACAAALRRALARGAPHLERDAERACLFRWDRCAESTFAAWSDAARVTRSP